MLAELLRIADFTTPSRFLETILSGPMQGRRKLYSRLGMAARDPIDELMNSALEFERNEIASLDRFLSLVLARHGRHPARPRRAANEVRVMTVHGAKGLEAPVVILADATADPEPARAAADYGRAGRRGARKAPLLRPKKEERCPPFEEIIQEQEKRDLEEHMAASLRGPDPRRGPADRQRGDAQGKEGWIGPASGQQLARDRRAGDELARSL